MFRSSLYRRTRRLAAVAKLRPSRRLGQSFLVDAAVALEMLELTGLRPDDWVLEIGAGLGALTFELHEAEVPALALERDIRLVNVLGRRLGPPVQLVAMDARRLDWLRISRRPPVLLASLPYPITSETLAAICRVPLPLRRAVLMVQREVAERLVAAPSTAARASLSVLVQLVYRARLALAVTPDCFWPRPKVHSTVVVLEPRPDPGIAGETVRNLLRDGFGKRRKTLSNALALGKRRPADLLERAGLSPRVRAQELSNEDWLCLAALLDAGDTSG